MDYQGQCWCEKVTFECEGEPIFTQHCHCNKCREVASLSSREIDKVGYAFTAAYLLDKFHILSNAQLEEMTRNNAKLLLCSNCKSFIYGISLDPKKQAGIGINANNFTFPSGMPESFKPVRHLWYANRVIDVNDDLPKFKDAPKGQNGTGELIS